MGVAEDLAECWGRKHQYCHDSASLESSKEAYYVMHHHQDHEFPCTKWVDASAYLSECRDAH